MSMNVPGNIYILQNLYTIFKLSQLVNSFFATGFLQRSNIYKL